MGARGRRIATALVIAAVIAPAIRNVDSYPLSTYPMYATARAAQASFATAVGLTDGRPRRLPIRVIADTDDPLIASSRVRAAIDGGLADQLCAEIARRAPDGVDSIEIVSETHDTVDLVADRPSLIAREVHATCPA